MVRLAEDSQHRARNLRDEFFDGRGPKLIAIPFLTANGAIKHHNSSNIISIRGEQQRLPPGLAHADDADARFVNIVRLFQVIHCRVQIFQRFVITQIHSRLPLLQGFPITRKALKKVGVPNPRSRFERVLL
jgi:hypothetical protein